MWKHTTTDFKSTFISWEFEEREKGTEYKNYWLVVQGFPILSQCPSGQLMSHLYNFRQERLINNFTFSSLLRFKWNAWWKNEQVHLSIPQIFCMVLFHRDFLLSFNGVSCVIKNTLKLTQGALTMTHKIPIYITSIVSLWVKVSQIDHKE